MRKICAYEVDLALNDYQYFLWNHQGSERRDFPDGRGVSQADTWKPLPVYIYQPKHKRGDFWGIGMASGLMGIAPWALDTVEMFAEMAGELLPLPYKDQIFTTLNITECIDCLDPERTEWFQYPNGGKRIVKPFFRQDRMSASTLFKSAHDPSRIYCWEYSVDPEEEFKACVEHHKLKGLAFKDVLIG